MPEIESELDLTPQRMLDAVRRRRWWFLLTAAVVIVGTLVALNVLPNRYTSEATIVVVQQRVPERYVVPNANIDLSRALQAMMQEVLSHDRLLAMIDEFKLYPEQRKFMAPEQLLDLMHKNIDVEPLDNVTGPSSQKDLNSFKISFTAESPLIAQQVTSRLTSLFIQNNLKSREDQASSTTSFLNEQLEAAKAKLASQEERLRDYKMGHLGELPEQQQGNLQILSSLQSQLQNAQTNIDRAQQQRVYLQSLIEGYRRLAPRGGPVTTGSAAGVTKADPAEAIREDLVRMKAKRAQLLATYGSEFPDVLTVEHEIAKSEALLESMTQGAQTAKPAAPAPDKKESAAAVKPADPGDAGMAQIESQLGANTLEINNLTKDEDRLRKSIGDYQARLNSTPVREQQLSDLLRDYDLMKTEYSNLLSKSLESQMATSLEKEQGGQQFRLVDSPTLPVVPSSPKRGKITLAGTAAALALGLLLAVGTDLRDRSFHGEKDLMREYSFPIVLGLALVQTPGELRARVWKRAFEWGAGFAVVAVIAAAEFYMYGHM